MYSASGAESATLLRGAGPAGELLEDLMEAAFGGSAGGSTISSSAFFPEISSSSTPRTRTDGSSSSRVTHKYNGRLRRRRVQRAPPPECCARGARPSAALTAYTRGEIQPHNALPIEMAPAIDSITAVTVNNRAKE
eukprot:TRINITY_DN3016_c0_g1_i1.p2 TRINITY_DN3016_c0_g1~~TRINITY_DN3016_c0_g1_i1.p2  ORF type:complete len:136 (-),score=9.26 TRINITY_DN3016_c0_g1_i1:182-589(-)